MKIPALSKPVKRGLLALPVLLALSAGVVMNVHAEDKAAAQHADHAAAGALPGTNSTLSAVTAKGDIDAARSATNRFHDINVAKASGYPNDATGCVSAPDGNGAMGHHYVNPGLVNDGGALDVTKPEVLVYEPKEDGGLSLVALEYVVSESDVPETGPAPTLFGQQFIFSTNARAWQLHAWVWRDNPSGMFAPFNPQVSCQFAG